MSAPYLVLFFLSTRILMIIARYVQFEYQHVMIFRRVLCEDEQKICWWWLNSHSARRIVHKYMVQAAHFKECRGFNTNLVHLLWRCLRGHSVSSAFSSCVPSWSISFTLLVWAVWILCHLAKMLALTILMVFLPSWCQLFFFGDGFPLCSDYMEVFKFF